MPYFPPYKSAFILFDADDPCLDEVNTAGRESSRGFNDRHEQHHPSQSFSSLLLSVFLSISFILSIITCV